MLCLVSFRVPFWAPYIVINDLPNTIKTKIRIYADDKLVYSCINTIDDYIQLQRKDLAELEKWAKIWQMEFNSPKCELLNITNQRSPLKFTYHINNVPIKEADFVSVVIDSKLTWKEHVLSKCCQIPTQVFIAFLQHNLRACSCNIKENCYKTSVRLNMLLIYGLHTLATQHINRMETLQRRAACFVCNKYTRNTSV